MNVYLKIGSRDTESCELSMETGEDWIDRWEDSSTVAAGNEEIGDGCDDADIWLRSDSWQNLLQGDPPHVVDDLGILHARAWGNVQSRHVPTDVRVADDGENPADGHR